MMHRGPLAALVGVLAFVALGSGALLPSPAGAQSPTPTPPLTLTRIDPVKTTGGAGSNVNVGIRIDDVTNLGSYEFTLGFDPNALSLVTVSNGTFLGSTGRSVQCFPPRFETDFNDNGVPDGVDTDLDGDGIVPEDGLFRFACVTFGGAPPGPSGSGLLSTVTFGTSCEGSSPLDFVTAVFELPGGGSVTIDPVGLADPEGRDIATRHQGGTVNITGGAACATPEPTATAGPITPVNTPTPATPSPTLSPTPPPTPVPQQCGAAAGVAVCVVPSFRNVPQGTEAVFTIAEDNASNLGAFQFTLVFNPAVVDPVDADVEVFLGSSGRTVVCQTTLGEDRLELVCVTLGDQPPGPDGSGLLAEVRLLGAGLGLSPLHLDNVILTDADANEIPVAALQDGALAVGAPATPTATVQPTDTPTPTETVVVASPTVTETATPCPLEGCPTATTTNTPSPTLTPSVTPTPTRTETPGPTSTASSTPTPGPTPVPPRCGTGSELIVCLRPLFQRISSGNSATLDVAVDNVTDLGAFQFTLLYNPTIVSVTSVEVRPFISSTIRPVNCLRPPSDPGELQFLCVTLGGSPPGPNGNGDLARITLEGEGLGLTPLALDGLIVTNVDGLAFPTPLTKGAAIEVAPAPTPTQTVEPTETVPPTDTVEPSPTLSPTPCPPGGCPTATMTPTPTRTLTPTPVTPTSTPSITPTATPTLGQLIVRVDPPLERLRVGETADIEIRADSVDDLGAFQFRLRFNPGIIMPEALTMVDILNPQASFLGSTGRSAFCNTPVLGPDRVEGVCTTLGLLPAGPRGSGVLATIRVRGVATGITPLHLEDVILTDVGGIEQGPATEQDGVALVDPPGTATATPTETGTPTETPTPAPGGSLAPGGSFFNAWPPRISTGERLVVSDPRSGAAVASALRAIDGGDGEVPYVAQQAPGFADVFIDPATSDLFIGAGPLVLAERVTGIPLGNGLQGFELDVTYNDENLNIDVLQHPFIASTGRQPFCLEARSEGRLRVSCFTMGGQAAPDGDGILIGLIVEALPELKLRAAENNGIPIFLDNVGAHTRLAGQSNIAVGIVGDATVTARALEGDTNGDCVVNVIDHQRMAGRYLLRVGSGQYDSFLDLEPSVAPDGDIDIRDLQVTYGRTGNSCADSLQFADQDGDACRDQDELSDNPGRGGQRNPLYPLDFFDTPPRDGVISTADIVAMVNRFGAVAGPPPKLNYSTDYDRTFIGPDPWDLGPPDGVVSITDIVLLVKQFGHTCTMPTFD